MSSADESKPWRFVTNHTQVLLCIARDGDVRLRDIAGAVGITERAAQRIVADLVEAGYVNRVKIGRRNAYTVNGEVRMRHASQIGHEVGELLDLLRLDPIESQQASRPPSANASRSSAKRAATRLAPRGLEHAGRFGEEPEPRPHPLQPFG